VSKKKEGNCASFPHKNLLSYPKINIVPHKHILQVVEIFTVRKKKESNCAFFPHTKKVLSSFKTKRVDMFFCSMRLNQTRLLLFLLQYSKERNHLRETVQRRSKFLTSTSRIMQDEKRKIPKESCCNKGHDTRKKSFSRASKYMFKIKYKFSQTHSPKSRLYYGSFTLR